MIVSTASACILLRAYTSLTFLYATFDIRDLASPGSGCSVTMASVVSGGEAESGSVFAVRLARPDRTGLILVRSGPKVKDRTVASLNLTDIEDPFSLPKPPCICSFSNTSV